LLLQCTVLLVVATDLAYRFLFFVRRAGENTTAIAASALSSPASKLVAEVIVSGSVNNLPFEIIRRRSARKAELHFTFNGAVLTTQAVKDTQALIDEQLGIQGGLLQRCCFFGQHTHTMQVSMMRYARLNLAVPVNCASERDPQAAYALLQLC
jgi:hypothetical protein